MLLGHSTVSNDREKTDCTIAEAKELFIRVKKESDDVELKKQAIFMQASCLITLGNPNEALELLDGTNTPLLPAETLLSSAYQIIGKLEEAKEILQVGVYQHIIALFGLLPSYLMLCADDTARFEEIYSRTLVMAEAFNIKELHTYVLINFYIVASQGYLASGNMDKALDILQKYTELVTGDIYPLQLQGDDFFHLLGGWLTEFDLGTAPPRNDNTIKQGMADMVINNPAFSALAGERRFQSIVERLKKQLLEDLRMDLLREYIPFLIPIVIADLALALTAFVHVLKHPHFRFGNKTMWH